MNKIRMIAAAATAALAFSALSAHADEGPWLVRARAVHLNSANDDGTGLGLSINDKWIPEVDVSYFFTPNIAAELILTYPQKQTVHSDALGQDIGTLKHLPPTLTVQYHFIPTGTVRPYVGAGINYTRFSSVHLANGAATIDKDSWGLAAQAGVDIQVAKNTYLNFDVKKVQISTDVSLSGSKLGTFKIDPWLLGVGVGYRF